MNVEYVQKKIEDSLFAFVDKILNNEGCSIKSRIKYYNEITSFVKDNVVSCEDEYNYALDDVKCDAVDSFQNILNEIKHVDDDSISSMNDCIESIETIAENSIREINDYCIGD